MSRRSRKAEIARRRRRAAQSDRVPTPPVPPEQQYDVIIVGYGPVGAVLANLLGSQGHHVAVFERTSSIYHLPRAAHFDHEVMRVFQTLGLADAIAATTLSLGGIDFLSGSGDRLFTIRQPEPPTPFSWSDSFMFVQPQVEAILRHGVERYDNVQVFLDHEVTSLHPREDHVHVAVVDHTTGTAHGVDGAYAIGADGARSIVRRHMAAPMVDLGFDESWLVVDVALQEAVALPEICQQICDPVRPTVYLPLPEPYRRWELKVLTGEDPRLLEQPARVYELLAPWVDAHQAEIVRAVVYDFHSRVAESWRAGRLLLAGDAAHQMPPFLGQGMGAGIRDAANLAWKLDGVLVGELPSSVLDTYPSERTPHVRAVTEVAVATGELISTTDPAVAAARDARLREHPDASPPVSLVLPALGPGILADGEHDPGVGCLFIQPWVVAEDGDPYLLDEVMGHDFAIVTNLAAEDWDALVEGAPERAWHALGGEVVIVTADPPSSHHSRLHRQPDVDHTTAGVPATAPDDSFGHRFVHDRDGYLHQWFEDRAAVAVLVRPDRYVYGIAHDPSHVGPLIEGLVDHLEHCRFDPLPDLDPSAPAREG